MYVKRGILWAKGGRKVVTLSVPRTVMINNMWDRELSEFIAVDATECSRVKHTHTHTHTHTHIGRIMPVGFVSTCEGTVSHWAQR